ncbi:PREDICTED: uncharacterized protein LOC104705068 [Camelina sativa]|uniref:Uncharacterized protein LOC104705068 n=1 Tax=Camelina sativa TaxID=90675 RepID=A0ABM0T1A1_CAMSA|nr:PREDICTED: uncharacterized protein LOC104705068 [Camelina sativa]
MAMYIYVKSGVWRLFDNHEWRFIIDEENRGRLLTLESSTTNEELKIMVSEAYGIEPSMVDMELIFLLTDLTADCPPVVIMNNSQVTNFLSYYKKKKTVNLCVTFKGGVEDVGSKFKLDLNKEPGVSSDEDDDGRPNENLALFVGTNDAKRNDVLGKKTSDENAGYGVGTSFKGVSVRKGQYFKNKEVLQATMELYAMRYNCDFRVTKSDTKFWCIRCIEDICKRSLRAECLNGSTYFKINKFVGLHTCAPSKKKKFCRTPSTKTIGHLIMQNYEGVLKGPKPNDINNIIRTEYGCDLTYSQAWESREYAVNEVRGIPEKSYGKIPKYLYMIQEANPGTFTNYEVDCNSRFKYLFISFGQSIRGFYKGMRKVIVVDGIFLKNKYKGVLLVATVVDGNYNLYPIAFGIADSKNDSSWEWFFEQLKVVIGDDKNLSFISYRHLSISKSLKKIYPLSSHGICIHHLIGNVITYHKGRSVADLVSRASKAYRVAEFEKHFGEICNISPAIGEYLEDAQVKKWARCHFPGYRYDLNTNNAAESINSALRSPREYPVISLLDSIREMLTRWFFERRELSVKQKDPLTVKVENKISRRIVKGKFFKSYHIGRNILHVKANGLDFVVDLERRTCSCGKFQMGKIPCRHAIKGAFDIGNDLYEYADDMYSTTSWREYYEETVNPIGIPENEWGLPDHVEAAKVLPPETRRHPGRRRKRRHEKLKTR